MTIYKAIALLEIAKDQVSHAIKDGGLSEKMNQRLYTELYRLDEIIDRIRNPKNYLD